MTEIKIDTQKINDCGKDLIDMVADLKEVYNELFSRLEKVPGNSKEWVGATSERYFSLVSKDKQIFIDYANDIYKYGEFLINTANEYENTLKEVKENL